MLRKERFAEGRYRAVYNRTAIDAFRYACRAALRDDAIAVQPAHLLLGVLETDDGGAEILLASVGTDQRAVRERVLDLMVSERYGEAAEAYGVTIVGRVFGV